MAKFQNHNQAISYLLVASVCLWIVPTKKDGPQNWTHPEPHSVPVEQFLAMLRFEQRDKLADLPIEYLRSGRDDFV